MSSCRQAWHTLAWTTVPVELRPEITWRKWGEKEENNNHEESGLHRTQKEHLNLIALHQLILLELVLNLLVAGLALLLLRAHSATHCDGSLLTFGESMELR